jgi:hypothetical protein
VLQPQFDRITKQFNLGGTLTCEVVPGVVTLGLFGSSDQLDRSLSGCVDENSQLTRNIAIEAAAVTDIEYAAHSTADASGSLGLERIAPWLPNVRAESGSGSRFRVNLSITDATWESLPALGRVFERQNHAIDCYAALCQDSSRVAYKVLRGKVKLTIHAETNQTSTAGVTVVGGSGQFTVENHAATANTATLSSTQALVLGVLTRTTKGELTDEGHCDGCGERGQPCCKTGAACDDSLVCLDATCRQHGYPGAPCDNGSCTDSAVCVRGMCQVGCGSEGLPCCNRDACTAGRACQAGQPARREIFVTDEVVERSGGLFGTDTSIELGSATCGDGRLKSRFATLKLAGDSSHCDRAAWMGSDPNDCRVRVDLHISPFGSMRCRVQILATEVDARIPTPQSLCK